MPDTPDTSENNKTIAILTCDLEQSPIGTRSRLAHKLAGKTILERTLERARLITNIAEIILLAPEQQIEKLNSEISRLKTQDPRLAILPLTPRPEKLTARIRAARAWNLQSWRGGAGQWTIFDEDYHPVAISNAAKQFDAAHVLILPAHAPFLDPALTSALVHHHLHKNHEMRLTYTPAAPGLSGILIRADMLHEMAANQVLPGQLLGYDPRTPTFDTLIREACMQVDPALSKIPNRFLCDTDRDLAIAEILIKQNFDSLAELALAAADLRGQGLGFGVRGDGRGGAFSSPRELEIELTPRRLTNPPGSVPQNILATRTQLDPQHWTNWFQNQSEKFPDDLLLTISGDGDPLLYSALPEITRAARNAGIKNIHLQTDLASDITPLLTAINEQTLDVLSINFYGDDAATYNKVAHRNAGAPPASSAAGVSPAPSSLYNTVMKNLEQLQAPINATGLPLVVPRILKVRETIPQLESFFDRWVLAASWAVIDGPTDRAGSIPFEAVVDMSPPKRRPCRRIAQRLLIRSDGTAIACDQDIHNKLTLGHIEKSSLAELWSGPAFTALRQLHILNNWNSATPCNTCKEWHRA